MQWWMDEPFNLSVWVVILISPLVEPCVPIDPFSKCFDKYLQMLLRGIELADGTRSIGDHQDQSALWFAKELMVSPLLTVRYGLPISSLRPVKIADQRRWRVEWMDIVAEPTSPAVFGVELTAHSVSKINDWDDLCTHRSTVIPSLVE